MLDRFLKKARELATKGEPFALAVVVRTEGPSSGKAGDKAIVSADGKLWGWIGGGCTQPVVVKEALKAMADGRTRLVRISPGAGAEAPAGVVDYKMTCHSGGALDIFIEPVAPKPRVLILGRSPVARTLARLAAAVNFSVTVAAPEANGETFPDAEFVHDDFRLGEGKVGPQTFVVVSTQGERDEEGLELALSTEADYIAFVASRTKAEKMLKSLAAAGAKPERLKRVRAPAGLAIQAKSPEEIAVSILAEIIQVKGAQASTAERKPAGPGPRQNKTGGEMSENTPQEAKDPICGMMVQTAQAKHTSEYQGKRFYFCCAGCKQKFDQQPDKYASAATA